MKIENNNSEVFGGKLDSIYRNWELYLFRLFKLAKYVEGLFKFTIVNIPEIDELLNEKGYDGLVKIPPNPFYFNKEDREIFDSIYSQFDCRNLDKEKDMRGLLEQIWNRISEIKDWLGIRRGSQFEGMQDSDKRLCNSIDIFIRSPNSVSDKTKAVLGDNTDIEVLRNFQRFLKDRTQKRGVISCDRYSVFKRKKK